MKFRADWRVLDVVISSFQGPVLCTTWIPDTLEVYPQTEILLPSDAQSGRSFKHIDLSFIPRNHVYKYAGMVANDCDPSSGKAESEGSLGLTDQLRRVPVEPFSQEK